MIVSARSRSQHCDIVVSCQLVTTRYYSGNLQLKVPGGRRSGQSACTVCYRILVKQITLRWRRQRLRFHRHHPFIPYARDGQIFIALTPRPIQKRGVDYDGDEEREKKRTREHENVGGVCPRDVENQRYPGFRRSNGVERRICCTYDHHPKIWARKTPARSGV